MAQDSPAALVTGSASGIGRAAAVSLIRTLSRVLAPGVRVNAVAPGWIAGEWMERTPGDYNEPLIERRAGWTPMMRIVIGADAAETITGETIVVDGGYAATS